jgi:hypothetical protein
MFGDISDSWERPRALSVPKRAGRTGHHETGFVAAVRFSGRATFRGLEPNRWSIF